MGYIDKGNLQRLLDAFELILHIFPEPHIKGAKGLVQKQNLGLIDQCTGDGHTLLLTAGQAGHLAIVEALETDDFQHLRHPSVNFVLTELGDTQTKGNVVVDIEMREQCVFLEYGVDFAAIRRNVVDPLPIEKYVPRRRLLETSNDAKGGCFAAAAGTQQCEKFTVIDCEINGIENLLPVKAH